MKADLMHRDLQISTYLKISENQARNTNSTGFSKSLLNPYESKALHTNNPNRFQTKALYLLVGSVESFKTMEDEVVMLGFHLSMFDIRVRIALAEKGVKYEYNEEDLVNTKSALLLVMNPIHKKVPVLIHNGKPICESLIIVEYIDEIWKDQTPLMPTDPYQRAEARFWADFVDNKVHEVAKKMWTGKVGEHEKEKEELIENLKTLEEVLGDKPYLAGDTFGFLDIALIPFYRWFSTYEAVGKMKLDCPKLIAWGKRCLERESVSKFLSDEKEIYEFVQMYRKKIGVD